MNVYLFFYQNNNNNNFFGPNDRDGAIEIRWSREKYSERINKFNILHNSIGWMSTIFIKVANKSHDLPQIRQNTDAHTIDAYITKLERRIGEWRGREKNTHAQKSATNYVGWKSEGESEHIGQCIIGIDNDSVRYDLLLARISCMCVWTVVRFVIFSSRVFFFSLFPLLFRRVWMKSNELNESKQWNWLRQMNTKHTHTYARERTQTIKKARTNWKVKPFVMEYTQSGVVEMTKKKLLIAERNFAWIVNSVRLRAHKKHNYFYADFHFVF